MAEPASEGASTMPWPARAALFGLAYLGAALLGHRLSLQPSTNATFWPAAGVYVAGLLLTSVGRWAALVAAASAASFACDVLLGRPPMLMLGFTAAGGAQALASAILVRRLARDAAITPGRHLRDTLAVGVGALAGPVVGATIGASVASGLTGASVAAIWPVWWAAGTLGILVVTPLILAAVQTWRERRVHLSSEIAWAEGAAVIATTLGCAAAVFWLPPSPLRPTFLILPPLLWAALRAGPLAVTGATLVLVLTAATGVAAGLGPFSGRHLPPAERAVAVQVILLVAATATQLLAAAAAERRAALARLTSVNAGLEQEVATSTAALRASEVFATNILHATSDCVMVLDAEGRLAFMNEPGRRQTEIDDLVSMVGRLADSLWPEGSAPLVRAAVAQARTGEVARCTALGPSASGAPKWWDATVSPMPSIEGQPIRLLLVARDVSEARRTTAALAESEERLRLALDAADLGTWRWEVASRSSLEWDARCRALHGVVPEAVVDYATWAALLPEDDLSVATAQVTRALDPADPEDTLVSTYRARHPNGTLRWLTLSGRAFFSIDPAHPAGRRAVRILGTVRDVTEQRAAETALRESAGRQAYLLRLGEALGEQSDPQAMMEAATSLLGRQLGVAWVGFGEIDTVQERVAVHHDWSEGRIPAITGTWRVDGFGLEFIRDMRVGRIVAIPDVRGDSHDSISSAMAACGSMRTRAILDVPLVRHGRVAAILFIRHHEPRAWTENEVSLVEETCRRVWDAAERARAETALRHSQGLFEELFEHAPDAILVVDRDGLIQQANAQAGTIFGYDRDDLLGQTVEMLLPERFRDDHVRHRRSYLNTERSRPMGAVDDLRGCRRDGSEVPLDITVSPLPGGGGRALAVVRDVTERRAAEAALRRSETRLRDLLDTLDLAAFMARSLDGTIRFWSAGCARLYGWTAAEAVGRTVHELLRTEFPVPPAEIEAALERGGEWIGDLRQQTRDGRKLVIAARKVLRPGLDGQAAVIIESITDATEQRYAEAALIESEAQFRAITDAMPQMVWATWPDGRTDYRNARWHEFTGVPVGGADDMWEGLVHPDDKVRLLERWQHSLRTRELYEVEHRLRRHDGVYRWVLARAVPVLDGQDRIIRWFGTLTDIEDIVDAREVLARSRTELERLVDERTRDLEVTQARLAHAQRMEALGQLAGGIAHDFNNVLQTVQGSADLMERRAQGMDDVRRLARMVGEAAERGSTITHRLLAFSRRGELRAEAVNPAALLGGMRDILRHTLGGTVEVRVEAEPGLPMLLADKGQLETVLVNLATNARDAMPGGGALTFSAASDVVDHDGSSCQVARLVALKAGRYVRLSVVDTGEGMTPEILAHVTEPFFTTKQQGRGTGLGLAMVKGFAEQSGGALLIESAPGCGTTVTLWFPVTAQPQAAVPAGKGDGGPARGDRRARILLVDDDPIVREVTAEQLEGEGYAVLVAESGAAALEALDAGETVDLVVSDLSMPGLDGIAVIREAQRRKAGLPAILLTGFATEAAELAVGGALSGTLSLLRKPVMAEQISERIETLLEVAPATGKQA